MSTSSSRITAIIAFFVLVMIQSFQVKMGLREQIDATFPTRASATASTKHTYDYDYIVSSTRRTTTTTAYVPPGSDEDIWSVTFGGEGSDIVNGSCATSDGGFVFCGNSNSVSMSLGSINQSSWITPYGFVVKFDSDGEILWSKGIGGNGITCAYDVTELTDGRIVVVGYTCATNLIDTTASPASVIDAFAFIYSSSGTLLSQSVLEGSGYDYFNCVDALSNGGYVVGGNSTSTNGDFSFLPPTPSAIIMAYDSNGVCSWTNYLTGTTGGRFYDISVDTDASIFATCVSNSSDGSFADFSGFGMGQNDTLVCKYSQSGTLDWTCVIASSGDDRFDNIVADGSGGCVVAGYFTTLHDNGVMDGTLTGYTSCGETDAMVFFINSSGVIESGKIYAGFYDDYINGIAKIGDCYALCGYTLSSNRTFLPIGNLGNYDAFAIVIDNQADIVDMHPISGTDRDCAYTLCGTLDGSLVVGGTSSSFDEFFMTTDPAVENPYTAFAVRYELA